MNIRRTNRVVTDVEYRRQVAVNVMAVTVVLATFVGLWLVDYTAQGGL